MFSKKAKSTVILLVFVLLTLWAWLDRFIVDDAFISFRYARNLVKGWGLVWNPYEFVEGYTNFLWTLFMAIPHALKIDPVFFSQLSGIVLLFMTMFLTYKIVNAYSNNWKWSIITVILLGINYSFRRFATGGLETSLQTFWFVLAFYLLLKIEKSIDLSKGSYLILSLVLACAVLTRPDSAILIFVISLFAWKIEKERTRKYSFQEKGNITTLIVPMVVIIGSWIGWKFHYYHSFLPNTFYAKVSPLLPIHRGLTYVYGFFASYWLLPIALGILLLWIKMAAAHERTLSAGVLLLVLWLIYVVSVGGDFMEYRFIIPIIPIFFITAAASLSKFIANRLVHIAFPLIVLGGVLFHQFFYERPMLPYNVESTKRLQSLLTSPYSNWIGIGKTLGQCLNYSPGIIIATVPSGAIPYYSKLKDIDMLGLTNKYIAHHGDIIDDRPGHMRRATFEYLIKSNVNLLIGLPWMVKENQFFPKKLPFSSIKRFWISIPPPGLIPAKTCALKIPIEKGYSLITLYIKHNSVIDKAIKKYKWIKIPLIITE